MVFAWPVLEVLESITDGVMLQRVFLLAFLGAVSDVAASHTRNGPFFYAYGATIDFISPIVVSAVRCHRGVVCCQLDG